MKLVGKHYIPRPNLNLLIQYRITLLSPVCEKAYIFLVPAIINDNCIFNRIRLIDL